MATLKEIRDRRQSVKSINKITSALKLVSTAKSQKKVKDLRQFMPFYQKLLSIVDALNNEVKNNSYSIHKEKTIWILYTSDLGLAGGFNSLLFKEFLKNFKVGIDKGIVFGTKGRQLVNSKLFAYISDFEFHKSEKFSKTINNDFLSNLFKKYTLESYNIKLISNIYVNQITTKVKITSIFPLEEEMIKSSAEEQKISSRLIFEPSAHGIVPILVDFYLETSINYYYINSIAAEESSRRNAMENATTNSDEMIKQLTKEFNRIRQAKITQEISELVSGS